MNESDALLPGSLAYYADEARGCTAEAVPTGDDDDAKIPGPSETGGRRAIVPPPDLADYLTLLNQGGRLCPPITACTTGFSDLPTVLKNRLIMIKMLASLPNDLRLDSTA